MRIITAIAVLGCVLGTAAHAQTTTNLTVTPTSNLFDCNNVIGVQQDAAPGFPYGSFASNGAATGNCASGGTSSKTDMYFTPLGLFGRSVTLGEIRSISYWTKKGTTHIVNPVDWYLAIYTVRYAGQTVSFYGARINAEPYFSENLNDPASTWNQWTTGGPANELRFYESTYGYFGGYADPDWAAFVTGSSLTGTHSSTPVAYADQPILYFSIQTGSAWAAGFTGQVDGLRIDLMDGSVATINFEPFLVPTDQASCMNNGWMNVYRPDHSPFKNQGNCIQYVNTR